MGRNRCATDLQAQLDHIARIWNSRYRLDWVTQEVLKNKFFESEFVSIVGPVINEKSFSLGCTRSAPFHYDSDAGTGWILWIGYEDKDAAGELLETQMDAFRRAGCSSVFYSCFTPGYFLPGVDADNYPFLFDFLVEHNFVPQSEAIAMYLDLDDYRASSIAQPHGYEVRPAEESHSKQLLDFISENFASDWYFRAENVLEKGEAEQVYIALEGGKILGYSMFSGSEGSQWFAPGERFGPFGVADEFRGRGIGSALLAKTLEAMKGRGIKTAYFLWTDEKAARLYRRFGFREKRRFTIMKREL